MTTQRKILWTSIAGIAAAVITLTALVIPHTNAYATSDTTMSNSVSVSGNGTISTETIANIAAFTTLKVSGNFQVVIKNGNTQSATLTTDHNLMNDYEIYSSGQTLIAKTKPFADPEPSQRPVLTIVTPTLSKISLSGNVSLNAPTLNTSTLSLNMSGNDQANISGDLKTVQAELSGNSELTLNTLNADQIVIQSGGRDQVTLSGQANSLEIDSAGDGQVLAKNLQANQVSLKIAGESSVTVNALKTLTINAAGDSTINYYGNPTINNNASYGRVQMNHQ